MLGEQTRKHVPRASFQQKAVICLGEQARVKPGPALPPHRPSRRGPEGQLPLSSSITKMCASVTYSPSHQEDSKVLLEEETEGQHECTELKGHKQTVL